MQHKLDVSKVHSALKTGKDGLSFAKAKQRLGEFGPNEPVEKHKISPWGILLE